VRDDPLRSAARGRGSAVPDEAEIEYGRRVSRGAGASVNRSLLGVALVASTLFVARASFAEDKLACLAATEKGQNLRADHKLVEARQQFLVCARPQCPSVVQQTCGGWLADLDRSLPTVVLTAKDGGGADLVDVTVTVDGQPLVAKLEGDAVPVDPGRHVFHFSRPDGSQLDMPMLVKEGKKNQEVAVVIPNVASAPGTGSTWKTVGWVLGGIGVAGVVAGAVAGGVAIADNGSAHCNATGNDCLAGPLSSAKMAAAAADVGLIAGGVLLAGGVALVLLAPTHEAGHESGHASGENHATRSIAVSLVPVVGRSSGGFALGGSF
jgi:hypothetical protein